MTREEAINELIRIRQQQGDKSEAHEALGMAIDALAYQAELHEGLEEEISRTYRDGSVTDTSDMDHVSYENIARHFAEWGAEHAEK